MNKEEFVYSRIGMALISAQRVEFITKTLLEHLIQFDKKIYNITSEEFLVQSTKSKKAIKTLGSIFKLLKLNTELIIEEELDDYLKKRNLFVHCFWEKYLNTKSDDQMQKAIDFCNDFGNHSDKISTFFQGFTYHLIKINVDKYGLVDHSSELWKNDYENFVNSLKKKRLN